MKEDPQHPLYIANEDLEGFNPDGPDFLNNDNGIIPVPKGSILMETGQYSEYSIEYEMVSNNKIVALSREWLCNDCSDKNYYGNYFSSPKGLSRYDRKRKESKETMETNVDGISDVGHILCDNTKLVSDVFENEKFYVIEIEAVGASIEDVKIELEKESRIMTFCVNLPESTSEAIQTESKYHLKERGFGGSYKRDFVIPCSANIMDFETTCKNGLVRIKLKK